MFWELYSKNSYYKTLHTKNLNFRMFVGHLLSRRTYGTEIES